MDRAGLYHDYKVFPARAGMILDDLKSLTKVVGIPRESGDDPAAWAV